MFRMGLVSLSARALFTFGVVALHFACVFVNFGQGNVYFCLAGLHLAKVLFVLAWLPHI